MALNFVSPGAAARDAIIEELMRRQALDRQAELDAQREREAQAALRQRDEQLAFQKEQEARIAKAQQATMDDLSNQREFTRASTIEAGAMPGDAVDPETAALMTRQGFGGAMRQIPGVLVQGPLEAGDQMDEMDREAALGRTPEQTVMRGGSRYLNAQAQREAQAAALTERLTAQDERAAADRELKQIIAGLSASGKAESQALANQLKALQIQLTGEKVQEATENRTNAKSATAGTRQTIRDLAANLAADPELGGITGPIEGRRDTFFTGGATDAVSRFNQLLSALALGERSKLKGQGQISDYEAKILQRAVTSLNRASGPEITKKTLEEIAAAFAGDTPQAGEAAQPQGGGAPAGGGRVYYDSNGNPVRR